MHDRAWLTMALPTTFDGQQRTRQRTVAHIVTRRRYPAVASLTLMNNTCPTKPTMACSQGALSQPTLKHTHTVQTHHLLELKYCPAGVAAAVMAWVSSVGGWQTAAELVCRLLCNRMIGAGVHRLVLATVYPARLTGIGTRRTLPYSRVHISRVRRLTCVDPYLWIRPYL